MTLKRKPAHLVLSDGTVFEGVGFGHACVKTGEVVFNTALTGYQEILTDPSYCGQIVVMTNPQIGNYGVVPADDESRALFTSGFVVREISAVMSNYRGKMTLNDWLKKNKIPGIAEIDTRALVRHIREAGAMPAAIAVGGKKTAAQLKKLAANASGMTGQNFITDVSCAKPYVWKKGLENFILGAGNVASQTGCAKIKRRFRVAAYDFGIKTNILRLLVESGCDVTVVPHAYPAEKLLDAKARYDGVFLSNGPGDPAACVDAVENVKKLLGKKPVFGICLGHQIIGLALGARTYKLKFGHHGANHPVMDLATRKVEITSQNHGFVVDDGTLPKDAEVTHLNLNDGTVEGLRHKVLPVFSVQYHPEAGPGPHDSRYLFERFTGMMGTPASAVASR